MSDSEVVPREIEMNEAEAVENHGRPPDRQDKQCTSVSFDQF